MSQVPGLGYRHLWGSVMLSTTSVSTSHSVLLEVLSGSRYQLLSLQVPKLALLSIHIYIVVVEIGVQTLVDSCHPVGISSAGSGMCGHYFWGRGKPRALSAMLTVTHLLHFNLRVPGPQDGERGPTVCWVAGSFLQRDLGQCLPQPHGRHHRVHDLQTAWLWGQWKSQLFCCS